MLRATIRKKSYLQSAKRQVLRGVREVSRSHYRWVAVFVIAVVCLVGCNPDSRREQSPSGPPQQSRALHTGETDGVGSGVPRTLPRANECAADEPQPIASFNVARDGDLLLLPVTMGNRSYEFLLDSGAGTHVVDTLLTFHLGNRVGSSSAAAIDNMPLQLEAYSCDTIRVGPLALAMRRSVVTMDLNGFRQAGGVDLFGFLGLPFFSDHVVRIDFDQGFVRVFSSTTRPRQEWGEAFPLLTSGRSLVGILAQPGDDLPTTFGIDTGSNGTGSLQQDVYDRLLQRGRIHDVRSSIQTTLAGTFVNAEARLNAFVVGTNSHKDLVFRRGKANRLGLKFWSRYCVTFDVPRKTLYLRPGKRHQVADRLDASGLHLLLVHGEPVAQIVDEGSPGWRAGMKSGDVLVNIDGTRAIDLKLFQIRRMLLEDGLPRVTIVYRRDDREHETVLELQPTEEAVP